MPIEEFNPVFRPVINPIDLEKLGQAYDTLEQGHLKAIDTASAVEAELAKLDLNEAEDEWRQQQVNKIKSAITNNSTYGNAYGALDDVIRENGSIMSNPGMIGRLRAQQDYKKYIDNLEKRTDIPEDYKAYFKEQNTYNYKDITDSKGNIIGGSKWNPAVQEVSTVPMSQLLDKALQWAAKESGGGSQTRWLDSQGKVTNDITKSVTGEIYSSATNKWERLSKDKLAAAVAAVIENTPGAKASLDQDYKIAKWKYDKSGGNNPDITNKDGILLTPEEYLNKRIDPFYKAATYYNQTSSTTYGEAWKAQLALARQQAAAGSGGASNRAGYSDILTTTTNPIRIDNFVPSTAQAEISTNKQSIADLLKASNPNLDFNLDGKTSNDIKQLIKDNIKDPMEQYRALGNLEIIDDAQDYLNGLKEGQEPDTAEAFDAYNAIISMSDLPKDNKYAKQYSKAVNNIFGSSQAIRQYFTSDDSFDGFIASIGGENKAKSLGITFGTKNGKKYAELPRDYNRSLYSFAKASREGISQNTNIFGALWNDLKGTVNSYWGNNVVQVGTNGDEIPVTGRDVQDNMLVGSAKSQNRIVFGDLIDFVDNRLKSKNDDLLKGGKLQVGQQVVTEPTPNAAELVFQLQTGAIKSSEFTNQYKVAKDQAMKAIRNIDLTQTGALRVGDNNMFEPIDSEDRKELTAIIRSAKENDLEIVAVQDFKTGEWSPQITILGTYDNEGKLKREPITLYAPGGFDSAIVESWNNDTTFKAKKDINIYGAAGRNINLTNASAFANIDKITMIPTGDGFNVYDKTNNRSLGSVSPQTAVDLRDTYYQWNDIYNLYQTGANVRKEAIEAIAEKTAINLANITGAAGNQNIIAYYYQQLINNIMGQ
ncbi:hypothetical protein [uncultured phage cr91_1]|uniref:Uncharacterized protein n=1 Tax=uncultured phage cr91_1 TaxID=2986403 RepID=A0AAE7RWZ9_9CAUD|nr:hypothetical protein M1M48_gp49 [uncultured phage cr91_1]QWM89609.1 hypothetical protein [uncultured phage cr91_1]